MRPQPTAENCRNCLVPVPMEWIPEVICNGKSLAGTGSWQSLLLNDRCPVCIKTAENKLSEQKRQLALKQKLIELGGGIKPYKEFSFESYKVTPGNELAFTRSRGFNSSRGSLYLWGPCGVGKTHLAYSIARRFCEEGQIVEFLKPPQLMRRVRLKEPNDEQRAIDRLIRADILVIDDLGIGNDTVYARQIFQEILDGRDYAYRAGLVVTSKYSMDALAEKLDDDTISSRIYGMCQVTEIKGVDARTRTIV